MAVKITAEQFIAADQAHTALQDVLESLLDDLADSSKRWRKSDAGMTASAALDQMKNALLEIENAFRKIPFRRSPLLTKALKRARRKSINADQQGLTE